MPTTQIFLGDKELTSKQKEALQNKFDKKIIEFEYVLSDTAPDGRFVSTREWKTAALWDAIVDKIKFPQARTPQKIASGIDRPGTYPVEVEVNGYSYKAKLVIKQKSGDKSEPVMKKGAHPNKVVFKSKANANTLPQEHQADLKDLLAIMQKPASYTWSGEKGSSKGWSLDFDKHEVKEHAGRGWKAYIDISKGTKTLWRLYFQYGYDYKSGAMMVQANQVFKEH